MSQTSHRRLGQRRGHHGRLRQRGHGDGCGVGQGLGGQSHGTHEDDAGRVGLYEGGEEWGYCECV